jgi:BioD-like phosphotransacetylase family protein
MKKFFSLPHNLRDMSPVLIPSGYTRKYIDGEIGLDEQIHAIRRGYDSIKSSCDVVLLEGTGHTGVGSVVELNNAQVAAHLGAEMILVANGGLGSAFDELELNRIMCKAYNVPIMGVILNKVKPDKIDMVRGYFTKLLKRWDVPLLGVVPDEPFLGRASLHDFEKLFDAELIAGERCRYVIGITLSAVCLHLAGCGIMKPLIRSWLR